MVPYTPPVHPWGTSRRRPVGGIVVRLVAGPLLLVAACAPPDGVEEGRPSSASHAAVPAPLPELQTSRSWQGVLPCADCDGIRTTLTLEPDGSYHRTDAYLGKAPEPDTLFGGIGHWTLSDGRTRIELLGSGEGSVYLAVLEDEELQVLDRSGNPIDSELEDRLRPLPAPANPAGRLRWVGAFTYMADAALLAECTSGRQFTVAMEQGYLPLERAYTATSAPGAPLVVRIQGTLESRPAMEGDGTERMVVVESHEILTGEVDCGVLRLREELAAGEWALQELDGGPVPATPGEVPTLSWDPSEPRVAGSGGCNRYSGQGFLRGSRLVVQEVAATRRFCEGVMELEARVLELLQAGGRLHLEGAGLVLFQGPDPLARFTRVQVPPPR